MYFPLITSLLFYGFWTFLGAGVMFFFADPDEAANFIPALSSGLLFVMLYWQLTPVVTAGFGASLDTQKLLIYPIPRGKLFTVEMLLRLTNMPEMVILTAAAAIGLMRNPLYGTKAAPLAISGFSIFVALNVLLSAGTRSLMERFFQRTRLKEAMLLVLVATGLGFRALIFMHVGKASFIRFAPAQIFWPWAATARLMLGDPAGWAVLAVALLYLVGAYVWGRWQFERGLQSEENELGRRERDAATRWRRRTAVPAAVTNSAGPDRGSCRERVARHWRAFPGSGWFTRCPAFSEWLSFCRRCGGKIRIRSSSRMP